MRKSNPNSADSGSKKAKSKGPSTKHSTAERERAPAAAKRARTGHHAGKSAKGAKTRASSKSPTKAGSTRRNASNKSAEAVKNPASEAVLPRLPENHHPGLHERSYAAHLAAGQMEPHSKPVGIPRHGQISVGRKQP